MKKIKILYYHVFIITFVYVTYVRLHVVNQLYREENEEEKKICISFLFCKTFFIVQCLRMDY